MNKLIANLMMDRNRKKSGWKIVVAVVAMALLSCGVLIALDVHKVAREKNAERKFTKDKTLTRERPAVPLYEPENN